MSSILTKAASRPLSLFILTSLDGKISRLDGGIDWIWTKPVEGPNPDCGFTKFMSSVEHVVTGRKTFDVSSSFEELPFPGKIKYVFTRSKILPASPNAETVYVNEDPVNFVKKLKEKNSDDENLLDNKIWLLGGAEIVRLLYDADLIDEIIVTVQPIIIGSGISLWDGVKLETHWSLTSSESWKEGLVQLTYNRKQQ